MLLALLPSLPEIWVPLRDALPVIISLIVIEGLLSVDNALAIAAMASQLDEKRRKVAMNIGYIGAYGFRLLALLVAGWIIGNVWVKLVGALYLVWLMCEHFTECGEDGEEEKRPVSIRNQSFASVVTMIALMDLSLSVDNVVAAIALSPDRLWPVYVGVTIGIVSLRLIAGYAVKMIERFPILEHTAFLLIGYVGLMLLVELTLHVHMGKLSKFVGIVLITAASLVYSQRPTWKKSLRPVLRGSRLPMELFARVIGGVMAGIAWPFKRAFALVKGG